MKLIKLKITKKELKNIIKPRKLFIAALGAVFVNSVILAPFRFPWDGWNTVISTVAGIIFSEWLD